MPAPPATFDARVVAVALLFHFALSLAVAALIAVILHRWGLLVGIAGGALTGLAVYCIDFYALSVFFPWFFAMSTWTMALNHVLFGAVAGGVYESLEIEVLIRD